MTTRRCIATADQARALAAGDLSQLRVPVGEYYGPPTRFVWNEEMTRFWYYRAGEQKTAIFDYPLGVPGDRIWFAETFVFESTYEYHGDVEAPTDRPYLDYSDKHWGEFIIPHYKVSEPEIWIENHWDINGEPDRTSWTGGQSMPRWASRFIHEITSVRVEKVGDEWVWVADLDPETNYAEAGKI